MSTLEALLFDVDGTLADTERDGHRVAFNRAFEDAGLDWNWSVELYGELLKVTGGKERMYHFVETGNPNIPQDVDLGEMIISLHAAKTEHYVGMLRDGLIPLRPGIERILREARSAGMRMAIATTTTPDNVEWLLKSTLGEESIGWFELIAAGDIVKAKKPAPDIYTYALETMNLSADNCVALEDSAMGLRSARDAGIKRVIITANGYTLAHDFSGATTVVDHLGEPGKPFQHLSGIQPAGDMIDLAGIQRLHSGAIAEAG